MPSRDTCSSVNIVQALFSVSVPRLWLPASLYLLNPFSRDSTLPPTSLQASRASSATAPALHSTIAPSIVLPSPFHGLVPPASMQSCPSRHKASLRVDAYTDVGSRATQDAYRDIGGRVMQEQLPSSCREDPRINCPEGTQTTFAVTRNTPLLRLTQLGRAVILSTPFSGVLPFTA